MLVGNSDTTPPAVNGVTNNEVTNQDVTATFTEGTATLAKDGNAPTSYTSGTAVSEEGVYVLVVTDDAGNKTTVNFTIDKTAPAAVADVAGASSVNIDLIFPKTIG